MYVIRGICFRHDISKLEFKSVKTVQYIHCTMHRLHLKLFCRYIDYIIHIWYEISIKYVLCKCSALTDVTKQKNCHVVF